jgi:translation initiation factor eIF-2B subunit epsilon
MLFSDNFDRMEMAHFVRGVLDDEEILGNKIFAHLLRTEYAARVNSLHAYDAISKDILHRWTFPIVPDSSSREDERYNHGRNHVYVGDTVTLARYGLGHAHVDIS